MKAIVNLKFFLKLIISLGLFMVISCANVSHDNKDQSNMHSDQTSFYDPVDTSLFLRFTSGIRSILEDKNGNTWFGSHNEGLALYDGKKISYFTVEDGLSSNQIRSIFEDQDGQIWLEGGRGITKYNGQEFTTITEKNYDFVNEWRLSENDLWFKGDEMIDYNSTEKKPGVYRYDGQSLNYHVFPLSNKTKQTYSIFPVETNDNDGAHYSVSTPFARGQNDRVWFGTYGAVIGYDGVDFTFINDRLLGLDDLTGFLHVRSLYEDRNGDLWIGNNGIGVWLYKDDRFIHFSKEQGLIPPDSQNRGGARSPEGSLEHVFAIGEDCDGNMWFGDRDTGAWRYDGNSLTNYTMKDGLTTSHIWQIYSTKNCELWLAMGDGSVCRFNGSRFEKIF